MVATLTHEAPAFPVTFADPDEANLTWNHDRMHFPRPVTPLFQSVWGPAFVAGLTSAARELAIPLLDLRLRWLNGYYFDHFDFAVPADQAEAQAMGAKTEATMREAIGRMMERWQGEWLPRLLATRARLHALADGGIDTADLVAAIDEVDAIIREDWLIHFRIVFPMIMSMQLYDELYAELLGGTEAEAHALLVGQPSMSVKAGIALAALAVDARTAGLGDAIVALPAEQVLPALDASAAGREFAGKIRSYLDEFGFRQDLFDFLTPTWREDPSIVIANLQSYLRSGHDAAAEHEAARRDAEAALVAARAELAGYPEPVRAQFEAMVQAARAANFLQEEHNFYIDQLGLSLARLVFLRLGDRLVAEGKIGQADDVLMLSIDELKAVAAGAADPAIRRLIDERWSDLEWQRTLTPPPFVGEPPSGPPPTDNPLARANLRFFGGPPQQAEAANQIKGNAGSRGTARGVARVALTLDEAKSLQPGEILVTPTTMPTWTPLFGTAAAVVAETGGPLSHCAIVAREYGIPAVVGAFGATRAIRTGQTITVDGNRGIVTLE